MQFTIIRDDNCVSIGGETYVVDCSALPADVHAVQWSTFGGEIEYRMTVCEHCKVRSKKPNEQVSDMAPYEPYMHAWRLAKEAHIAAIEAARAAAEEKARADAAG